MAKFDRKHPTLAFDADKAGDDGFIGRTVQRGRHQQQPEVGTQRLARLQRQRQREVAFEAAFVHLVKQHRSDAGQFGVGDQHPRENAFGDDFDACRGRHLAVHAGAITDRRPYRFAGDFGHPLGGRARGEPARRQ